MARIDTDTKAHRLHGVQSVGSPAREPREKRRCALDVCGKGWSPCDHATLDEGHRDEHEESRDGHRPGEREGEERAWDACGDGEEKETPPEKDLPKVVGMPRVLPQPRAQHISGLGLPFRHEPPQLRVRRRLDEDGRAGRGGRDNIQQIQRRVRCAKHDIEGHAAPVHKQRRHHVDAEIADDPIRHARLLPQVDVSPVFVQQPLPPHVKVVRKTPGPRQHETHNDDEANYGGRSHIVDHGRAQRVHRKIDDDGNGRDGPVRVVHARVVEKDAEKEYEGRCGGVGDEGYYEGIVRVVVPSGVADADGRKERKGIRGDHKHGPARFGLSRRQQLVSVISNHAAAARDRGRVFVVIVQRGRHGCAQVPMDLLQPPPCTLR
eukprot:Opistho-1_new@48879